MTKGAFISLILFMFSDSRFYLQKVVEGIEHDSIYIESINIFSAGGGKVILYRPLNHYVRKYINMVDFLKYFSPLSTDIERGYRSIIILNTIYELASTNDDILRYINKYPWFWVETINAHRSNVFINLGKIFDTDTKAQSIHFLKRWLIENDSELEEERIKERKGSDIKKINWDDYKKYIHIFSTKDFSSYGKKVSSLQKKYNYKLKDWRNKIFAHREHCENEEIQLENVRYDYIEQIYAGLHGLYNDAFNAVYNGYRFSLEPRKLSNEEVIIQQTIAALKINLR